MGPKGRLHAGSIPATHLMKREKLREPSAADRYGIRQKTPGKYFSSGTKILDKILGGGYARGRMENIIGDFSTGKTLLAIEACANFNIEYPRGLIRYNEVEAAFDLTYARKIGLPLNSVEFPEEKHDTVEDVIADLKMFLDRCEKKDGGLYIIDSWDSLSDKAEMERKDDKGSYGMAMAKKASEMFRKLTREIGRKNVTLIVISQVRDAINVMFGPKLRRAGGKALDFYATHCIWLAKIGRIKAVRKGIERKVGVNIRVTVDKNKVSEPYGTCDIPLLFSYGMDDIAACALWLVENKRGKKIGINDTQKAANEYVRSMFDKDDEDFSSARLKLHRAVDEAWIEIEQLFKPKRRKYGR